MTRLTDTEIAAIQERWVEGDGTWTIGEARDAIRLLLAEVKRLQGELASCDSRRRGCLAKNGELARRGQQVASKALSTAMQVDRQARVIRRLKKTLIHRFMGERDSFRYQLAMETGTTPPPEGMPTTDMLIKKIERLSP